jgi:hypothetical protein
MFLTVLRGSYRCPAYDVFLPQPGKTMWFIKITKFLPGQSRTIVWIQELRLQSSLLFSMSSRQNPAALLPDSHNPLVGSRCELIPCHSQEIVSSSPRGAILNTSWPTRTRLASVALALARVPVHTSCLSHAMAVRQEVEQLERRRVPGELHRRRFISHEVPTVLVSSE